MSLQLLKAGTSDALTLNGISKRAFDSDILVLNAAEIKEPSLLEEIYEDGKKKLSGK